MKRSIAVMLLAAVFVSSMARGQGGSDADKATARQLGQEGQEAAERGDHKTALELFSRAERLYHAPTLLIGMARAQVSLGKLVSARESYARILRDGVAPGASAAFKQAFADAERELDALEPRVPFVVLTVQGPAEPSVVVDGEPFAAAALGVRRVIDPGKHRVVVSAEGYKTAEVQFDIAERETKPVQVALTRAASPPPHPQPSAPPAPPPAPPPVVVAQPPLEPPPTPYQTVGWIAVGMGGVGVLVGSIAGAVAIDRRSSLLDACGGDRTCPASAQPLHDRFTSAATVSTIGYGAGALGLALGIPLLLSSPSSGTASARPCLLGSQVGLCGKM